jgi:hypothetical protein
MKRSKEVEKLPVHGRAERVTKFEEEESIQMSWTRRKRRKRGRMSLVHMNNLVKTQR